MEPLKGLIVRAWETLTDGWRELLTRSGGALTHFGGRVREAKEPEQSFPSWSLLAAETWETALSLVIRIEIPGVEKQHLSVVVNGTTLRIRGERRTGDVEAPRHYHLMERAFGKFERNINLPQGVDAEHAEVSYRDGVLTVILAKSEATPPIRLPVSK